MVGYRYKPCANTRLIVLQFSEILSATTSPKSKSMTRQALPYRLTVRLVWLQVRLVVTSVVISAD